MTNLHDRTLLRLLALMLMFTTACGSSQPDGDAGAGDALAEEDAATESDAGVEKPCAEFPADACPTERCMLLDAVDLSADREAEKPNCTGDRISLCTHQHDGNGVNVVLYRSADESLSAILVGGGFGIEGWETCPQFPEAFDGTEPPVCTCSLDS